MLAVLDLDPVLGSTCLTRTVAAASEERQIGLRDVCFSGQGGNQQKAQECRLLTQRRSAGLLDDFIRECEHRGRDVEAKSLGSRERR